MDSYVGQDIKAVCVEYLFLQQRLCKCVSEWLWITRTTYGRVKCVLPQVALWGKGILCIFVAIFAALHPLLPQCRYLFDLCVILWGRLRIWGQSNLTYMRKLYLVFPKCETLSHQLTWSHYFELLSDEPISELFQEWSDGRAVAQPPKVTTCSLCH